MSEISREFRRQEPLREVADERSTDNETARNAISRQPQRGGKGEASAGLHRTATAIRTMVPLIQKLLPLLDGNVASAVANLVAPRILSGPAVDLGPIETALMRVRSDLAVIQDKNAQQETSLKRIDYQLETLKETIERASLEQKEAAKELSWTRRSVRLFALAGVVLLVISIGLNAAVFLYVKGSFH